ncbi:MAG TPA: EAL domain-containing protein [Geminicoccus sp.]|uniref:putative bifunctional diguanylate cyclase/phosphodiesterase n=1 Tax=Geminicoccus sp. TaxID=2024832 RepID=UPI002CE3DC8D|nr:EAL domain-containing protein [Geminicoccus sp.]HWL68039.1 EAL domain-containing protein [Geminicoccus sp.]
MLPAADLQAMLDGTERAMLLVTRPDEVQPHPVIVWANRALRELTGLAGHELAGARLRRLRAGGPDEPGFAALLNALAAGQAWTGELNLPTRTSGTIGLIARIEPLADGCRALVTLEVLPAGRGGPGEPDLAGAVRLLGDLIGGGLYRLHADVDAGLKLVWADAAVERLTGYALPELLARGGLSGLVVPRHRARLRRRNLDLMNGVATEICYRLRTADGREIRMIDRARPLRTGGGAAAATGLQVDRAVGTLRLDHAGETTGRGSGPSAEAQLMAELLDGTILMVDAELQPLWVASGHDDALSLALADLDGGPLDEVLGEELAEQWRDWIEQALVTGRRTQTGFRWPASGQVWHLLATPMGADAALLVVRPLPAGQDERIGQSPRTGFAAGEEPFLQLVLEHVADGVLVLGEDETVRRASRAAERIFGLPASALHGRSVASLFQPQERQSAGMAEAPGRFEERTAVRAAGELVPVEVLTMRLPGELPGGVLIVRDMTLRKQTDATIRNLAYTDPLTGLPNRLLFLDRLEQAIERARRNRQELAVMVVDLDRFKLINESLGLDKGDRVLRAVAMRIGNSLRKSDTVARPGSDEFLVLALATDGAEGAGKVAQKILDSLQAPFQINGDEPTVTASVGIALFPHDGDDPDQLLRNAGTALARAKEQASHSYQFYTTDMNAKAYQRLVLESRLRKAVERGELSLHFQPLVDLQEERIAGVEALLRWNSPELGFVPPSDFISIAEETGLILPIGEWVLRQAVAQMREWHGDGLDGLRIAVNISARQFQARDFVAKIRRLLADTGFPGPFLELELTESSIMRDVEETVHRLRELAELGVRVTVDDFGTGYSSLAYLKRFPIGALKIDRSFIADVTTDANDAAIARAVVALAETLKVRVVGEGVETRQQFEFLRALGCNEAQGYLIGRPMPAADALVWLRNGGRPA